MRADARRFTGGAIRLSLLLAMTIATLVAVVVGLIGYTTNQEVTDIFDRSAHDSRELAVDNVSRFANLVVSNTAVTVAPSVLDHNYSYIRSVLGAMTASDDNLVYVGVFDDDGTLIEERGSRQDAAATMSATAPITSRGRTVGRVDLLYSTRQVDDRIRDAQEETQAQRSASLRNLVIGGGLVLGVGIVVAFGFGMWLARPVRRMAQAASQLGEGTFDVRVDERGPSELRQLASTFNSMAGQLGASVEASIERAALEREVAIARRLQRDMMPPDGTLTLGGLELASWYAPAGKMAGDWWTVDDAGPGRPVTLMIGDVIGHGIPAALYTAAARSAYRTAGVLAAGRRPDELLSILDKSLRGFGENSTMSCAALQLDVDGDELSLSLGAHPTPLLFRCSDGAAEMLVLDGEGPLLGDLDPGSGACFTAARYAFGPGDLVALVTDGIIEATNDRDRMYGLRRLGAVILEHANDDLETILAAVKASFAAFVGDAEQADDVTVVLVRHRRGEDRAG